MNDIERITCADNGSIGIDASELAHQELNRLLKDTMLSHQDQRITLHNVYGQRYIGTNLKQPVTVEIFGTPGNDLGAFMDGPTIHVHGNSQDGTGNTMNSGEIIIHGNAGDIAGFAARSGEIHIRGNAGYRVGIHMKEYEGRKPILVIGGTAQDFLGEYMAGGVLIVLGLNFRENERHRANFIGTGMHGGVIYMRGTVEDHQLGEEVSQLDADENDMADIRKHVSKFAEHFGYDEDEILSGKFAKLLPLSHRPYGRLYAY